jgi:hypothetical protein
MYIFERVCYTKSNLEKWEQNNEILNYNVRQNLNLHVQFCRTNVLKNGMMNMGITLHNKIPNKIREVEKMRHFTQTVFSEINPTKTTFTFIPLQQ